MFVQICMIYNVCMAQTVVLIYYTGSFITGGGKVEVLKTADAPRKTAGDGPICTWLGAR
jgi:hypothetical protein